MQEHAPPPYRYSFRAFLPRSERVFTLTPDGLAGAGRDLAYREIQRVRLYQVRAQDGDMIERCKLYADGRTVLLQSAHVSGWATVQDRTAQYEPFVWELLVRIAHANPAVLVLAGMPSTTRVGWFSILVLAAALGLGGSTLVLAGEWDGVWPIVLAATTVPLALSMIGKKPARPIELQKIAQANGLRDL